MHLLNNTTHCVREKASTKHNLILLPDTQYVSSRKVVVLQTGKCITRGGTILDSELQPGDRVLAHQGDAGVLGTFKAWKDLDFEIQAAIVPETVDYINWLKEALPEGCSVSVVSNDDDGCVTIVIHVKKGANVLQLLFQENDLKMIIPYSANVPDRNIKESV